MHHRPDDEYFAGYYRRASGLPASTVGAAETTDAATVYVDIQPSSVEQYITTDAATIYIDIEITGGECYSTTSAVNFGEGEAILEWSGSSELEWSGEASLEWSGTVSVGEEVIC